MKPFGLGWPNVISIVRIAAVPVLVWLLVADAHPARFAAASLFAGAAATDVLDGYLARRHRMTTRTGQWLDPVSDKLLVVVPMLVLAARGDFPVWAAVVIAARELMISGLRVWRGRRGKSMPATTFAKAKTVSQILAITLYLSPGVAHPLRLAALAIALILTLSSGALYFVPAPTTEVPAGS